MPRSRPEPYTDSEISAWDDGFSVAIQVARAEIIKRYDAFKSAGDASTVIGEVEAAMQEWLDYQKEHG